MRGTIAALLAIAGQDTSGVRMKVVEWSMAPHSLDSTSVTGIQTRRGHLPSSKRLANTADASLICAQISNVTTITITKYTCADEFFFAPDLRARFREPACSSIEPSQ